MKFVLELIGMSLIAGVFLSADDAGDIRRWLAVAFGIIGAAALLFVIADLIPDSRPRRRKRRARRRAKPEQVATLQPADEEERVWY